METTTIILFLISFLSLGYVYYLQNNAIKTYNINEDIITSMKIKIKLLFITNFISILWLIWALFK